MDGEGTDRPETTDSGREVNTVEAVEPMANKSALHLADAQAQMDQEEAPSIHPSPHRRAGELKENTGIIKSAFNIFKANVGTGVFMLPTFYPDAGYIMSVFITIGIGCIVVDCTHMLLQTSLRIGKASVTTYSQVCEFVYGPILHWILFVALCATQFGFCLMYSQLATDTLDQLIHFDNSQYLWTSVVFLLCFPMTCYSDNLSLLGMASILATVAVFYCVVSCFIQSARQLTNDGVHPSCNKVGNHIPLGWFKNLANDMMTLEGIAVILPVYASCTRKWLVPRAISIVLSAVIILYLIFGLVGYLAFGTSLTTSLVAAMNRSAWGTSIRILFVINIIFTYPLQFQCAMLNIDQMVGCTPRSWLGLGLRAGINLIVWALSMALGSGAVNTVVAFIGALPSTMMVLIIPSLLVLHVHYAVAHPEESRMTLSYWRSMPGGSPCTFQRIRATVYLFIGLFIMVIGTYSIIVDL